MTVNTKTELALAPLSVLPQYQCMGIGQALIKKGHEIARELGYDYSIVLGEPEYYSKSGYRTASLYGIKAPFDVPDENFMAIPLNSAAELLDGMVKYDPAFGI